MNSRQNRLPAFQRGARPYRWRHRDEVRSLVLKAGCFTAATIEPFMAALDACALLQHGAQRFALVAQYTRYEAAVGLALAHVVPGQREQWIVSALVVDPAYRTKGFGRDLLAASEQVVRSFGGTRLRVAMPARWRTATTTAFLGNCGYRLSSTVAIPGGDTIWYYAHAVLPGQCA